MNYVQIASQKRTMRNTHLSIKLLKTFRAKNSVPSLIIGEFIDEFDSVPHENPLPVVFLSPDFALWEVLPSHNALDHISSMCWKAYVSSAIDIRGD